MERESENQRIIVAQDERHRLFCHTNGIAYQPDPAKHKYGKSERKPLEDWFLAELDFFRSEFPDYEIFTLGSSCVFGEKFITYLTICEFEIETEQDFSNLKSALKDSDQAIRRKFNALWKWDMAARSGNNIAFMVGHLDFAYFLIHREEFKGRAHSVYMRSFTNEKTIIKSRDYKVLHDGTIVPFEASKLDEPDMHVFQNYNQITFETVSF